MTLEAAINLIAVDKLSQAILQELPDVEIDCIDIYMSGSLDLNSELKFVDAEKMSGETELKIGELNYVNLFPLAMFTEMVKEYLQSDLTNTTVIAKKILDYRVKDA